VQIIWRRKIPWPHLKKPKAVGANLGGIRCHAGKRCEVLVFHDEILNRTTNGDGYVKNYSYAELEKLDAGSWFGKEFSGEKIPTFGPSD